MHDNHSFGHIESLSTALLPCLRHHIHPATARIVKVDKEDFLTILSCSTLAAAQLVGNFVCEAGLRNKGHLVTSESTFIELIYF